MNDRPAGSDHGSLDVTLDEHRQCMRVVASVEACLDRQPDQEGRWIGGLAECLPRLADTLRAHFRAEEQGPLYREMPVRYPRFARLLDKLASEHDEILDLADATIRQASSMNEAERNELHELREFNARVQLLVAMIRRHEAEENEVVMSAHWNEVGTGD